LKERPIENVNTTEKPIPFFKNTSKNDIIKNKEYKA